jgi:hypothetical protein
MSNGTVEMQIVSSVTLKPIYGAHAVSNYTGKPQAIASSGGHATIDHPESTGNNISVQADGFTTNHKVPVDVQGGQSTLLGQVLLVPA